METNTTVLRTWRQRPYIAVNVYGWVWRHIVVHNSIDSTMYVYNKNKITRHADLEGRIRLVICILAYDVRPSSLARYCITKATRIAIIFRIHRLRTHHNIYYFADYMELSL